MTRPADHRELQELIDEARQALDWMERGRPESKTYPKPLIAASELLARARREARDGYPTSTMSGPGGPATVLDDEGVPMAPLNDPVGEHVVNDQGNDPVRHHALELARILRGTVNSLRVAVDHLGKATPHSRPADDAAPDCCVSHQRFGMWEPVDKDGRCRWCYEWRRVHQADPPEPILRHRAEGRRITSKVIAEASRASRRRAS